MTPLELLNISNLCTEFCEALATESTSAVKAKLTVAESVGALKVKLTAEEKARFKREIEGLMIDTGETLEDVASGAAASPHDELNAMMLKSCEQMIGLASHFLTITDMAALLPAGLKAPEIRHYIAREAPTLAAISRFGMQ